MLTPEQLWEKEKDFCEKYTGDCIRERDFIRIITKRDKLSSQLKPLVMTKIENEMAKSTILQECCEALGWQGGTIHQIKQVLIKAQKARRAYRTMNMPQANDADIEYFKASMAELDYVLSNSF